MAYKLKDINLNKNHLCCHPFSWTRYLVVVEVLPFVRLSIQFQQLKAENHPEVAVVGSVVIKAVSTEKIRNVIRAIFPSQMIIERETESYSYLSS